jgi:predicted metal-dependent phosphoesterase TrpH
MRNVLFEKPQVKKGYCCVDMHIHSTYSRDSTNSIYGIIKTAYAQGIGVAICDHDEIEGSLAVAKYAKFIIPAVEVTSNEDFHILTYFYRYADLKDFYKKYVSNHKKEHLPALSIIEAAHKYKSIVSFAHPYRILSKTSFHSKEYLIKKIYEQADCVEAINGKNFHRENKKALVLAKKGITGGSDAHSLFELGSTITYVKNCSTTEEFLDNVKKGNATVVGLESSLWKRVAPVYNFIKKKFKKMIG